MEWSSESTLTLIDTYKSFRMLWDPKNLNYYNKTAKNEAWERLGKAMDIPTQECQRKMTSLLSSLRREKGKIRRRREAGKVKDGMHSSTWFAYKSMLFIINRKRPRKLKPFSDGDDSTPELDLNLEDSMEPQKAILAPTPLPLKPTVIPIQTQNAHVAEEVHPIISNVMTTATVTSAEEECHSFGNFITHKLRNYSSWTRNAVQHAISNILFNADQGQFEEYQRPPAHLTDTVEFPFCPLHKASHKPCRVSTANSSATETCSPNINTFMYSEDSIDVKEI